MTLTPLPPRPASAPGHTYQQLRALEGLSLQHGGATLDCTPLSGGRVHVQVGTPCQASYTVLPDGLALDNTTGGLSRP